jgi:hypothetical protein
MKRVLLSVLVIAGLIAVAQHLILIRWHLRNEPWEGNDAAQIWYQANRIRGDSTVYRKVPEPGPHVGASHMFDDVPLHFPRTHSPHLPLLGSVTALMPYVPLVTFQRVMSVVLALATLGFAAVLAWLSLRRLALLPVLAWFGVVHLSPGAFFAIKWQNPEAVLYLLFALAVAFPRFMGAGLALVASQKPYAIWPILFGVVRDKRFRASVVAGFSVSALLAVLAMGPRDLVIAAVDWLRVVPTTMGEGSFARRNVSVSFGVLRALYAIGLWDYQPGPLTLWPRVWLTAAQIAIPIAVGVATRKLDLRWHISLVLLAALLASPLCWDAYLTVGWVPVALWIGGRSPGRLSSGDAGGPPWLACPVRHHRLP